MKKTLCTRRTIAWLVCGAGLITIAALRAPKHASAVSDVTPDRYADLPRTVQLLATIRDFKANSDHGHPDFETFGGTTTVGLASTTLDGDGKPTAASLRGKKIVTEFKDHEGRNINPALYGKHGRSGSSNTSGTSEAPGGALEYSESDGESDVAGVLVDGPADNGLASVESFAQWYRDIPGVNVSKSVPLTFNRVPNSNTYVFDSATDEPYKTRGGFFPIDGDGFGNFGATGHNFHFTTELAADFTYNANGGQLFQFTGDDDVWVYIDGKLVVDLGGLHSKKAQFLDLNRLDWLQNGKTYTLRIFHAERHTTQSNFRIQTTLRFQPIDQPATTSLFD